MEDCKRTEVARSCLSSEAELTRRPYLEMGDHPEVNDFIRVLQGECETLPPPLYGRDNEPDTLMDVVEVAEAVSFGLASRANCFAMPLARVIAENSLPKQTVLADIGAGSPHVAIACLEAMPQLVLAKLVDRANGMRYVRRMLNETPDESVLERLELCEEDFFQAVPAADIYNISNTAHDWLESEYLEIMANVRKAISRIGLVCIHEPLLVTSWDTKEEWCEALWMACYAVTLFRLTRGKGSCYSVAEHDAIQRKAGFTRIAAPIRTVDGCTALFYALPGTDQDSTFARKIGRLHDSEVKARAKHAVAKKRVRHAKTRG